METDNMIELMAVSALLVVGGVVGYAIGLGSGNRIKEVDNVQVGYIAPQDIRIKSVDLDGDGNLETLIRIKDEPFLLRNVDGKSVMQEYQIAPVYEVEKR